MKRILFLRANPVSPDPRVDKEAASLAAAGYDVTVLAWGRDIQQKAAEVVNGYQIIRLQVISKYAKGLLNLPAMIRWQIRLYFWLNRNAYQFDLIHACDFDTILPALLIANRHNLPVIYDIFDFYADTLNRTPGFLKHLIRGIDIWAINHAAAVILADESRLEQITDANAKQVTILYNSPDESQILHSPTSIDRGSYGLRIAYVGMLENRRGLMQLLHVIAQNPNWHLDLAGYGRDESTIKETAANISNVSFHGTIQYDFALKLNSDADVLLATYDPSVPNHRYSSPNKVFEAMLLGKPIIVAQNTNADRIVENHEIGIAVNYGDESDLQSALKQLESNEYRKQIERKAKYAYDNHFSWKIMEKRLLELYKMILVN